MKFCIIGCGKQSEKYVGALQKKGVTEFVAIDNVSSMREAFVEKFQCGSATDLDAALSQHRFDGALICTPVHTHVELASKLVKASVPFVCEKPLSNSLEEAIELATLTKEANVLAGVSFTYRYVSAFAQMREHLNALHSPIGDTLTAVFRIGGRGNHRAWKHMQPHGGATNEMFSHMLDLAYWLFGEFEELEVKDVAKLQPVRMIGGETVEVDAEDLTVVRGLTKSGVNCTFMSDFVTPSFVQYAEVQGTNGTMFGSIQPFYKSAMLLNSAAGDLDRGEHPLTAASAGPVDAIAEDLIENVKSPSGFRCTLQDALVSQRYMDDVLKQVREKI